jgi:hypothetical protein
VVIYDTSSENQRRRKMRRFYVSLIIIIGLVVGCSNKLMIKQASVNPEKAAPGDAATFIVVFTGAKNTVQSVSATVREYPEMTFPLNDSGIDGDEKAGDNLWSYQIEVPWEAPAQPYHFDLRALDKEGNEVISKGFEQQSTGRSGSVLLTVE